MYGITIFASFVICLGNRPHVATPYRLLCLMSVVLEMQGDSPRLSFSALISCSQLLCVCCHLSPCEKRRLCRGQRRKLASRSFVKRTVLHVYCMAHCYNIRHMGSCPTHPVASTASRPFSMYSYKDLIVIRRMLYPSMNTDEVAAVGLVCASTAYLLEYHLCIRVLQYSRYSVGKIWNRLSSLYDSQNHRKTSST